MIWVTIGCAVFAFVMGFFCGKRFFHYWWTEEATDIITRYDESDNTTVRAVTVYYDRSLFMEDREKLGWKIKTNDE